MAGSIHAEILRLADEAGESGITMGGIVDRLEAMGSSVPDVELAIWELLGARRLTPAGFVCRTVRRPAERGYERARSYEFLLVPWSPERDQQLELDLGE